MKKSSGSFSLSDLEGEPSIKKDKVLPKPRALALRPRSSSKRKKSEEMIEVPDSPVLIDFHEALKHGNMVLEQMDRAYNEKIHALEESHNQIGIKDKIISKHIVETNRLGKEVDDLKKEVADHAKDLEEVVSKAKISALISIYEARIKMAKEAAVEGFASLNWDVDSWEKNMVVLKGEDQEGETAGSQKEVASGSLGDEGYVEKA